MFKNCPKWVCCIMKKCGNAPTGIKWPRKMDNAAAIQFEFIANGILQARNIRIDFLLFASRLIEKLLEFFLGKQRLDYALLFYFARFVKPHLLLQKLFFQPQL